MSIDLNHIHLSNQARWYLNGHWPVYDEESYPGAKNRPEPKAMQELVDKGLTEPFVPFWDKNKKGWRLTPDGIKLNGRQF